MQGRLEEQDYIGFANIQSERPKTQTVDDEAEELKAMILQGRKQEDVEIEEGSDYEEEEARIATLIKQGTMGSYELVTKEEPDLDPTELELKAYERSKRF